jgi:serine protease AprX
MSIRVRGARWLRVTPVAVALGLTVAAGGSGAAVAAPAARAGLVGSALGIVEGLRGPKWRVDTGQNSLHSIQAGNGAHRVWTSLDRAGRTVTGKGIGVALIDSGIAPVEGLSAPGKVVHGPDLSFESQTTGIRNLDTFGHGTHLAGIIAGRDSTITAGKENDPKRFAGMAPDATLVSPKVATADGASDVSQLLAAINWTIEHRNDPGLNIRVLNLSYGTDSTQDPRLDPLSHAVEAAWRAGIVVVAAVGNGGPAAARVTMPAVNPYVIAVGGADPHGTVSRLDDTVGDFSSRGSTTRHADLVAAGRSVVSLRAPGSHIDTNYPGALIPTDREQRLFRGSGTSQATAVVSGAAALLLQKRPDLSPDQVKRLLTTTAAPMPGADPVAVGAGQLDVAAAAQALSLWPTPAPAHRQTWPASLGYGSLEKARGTSHVADPLTGDELVGERDIMGQPWNGPAWSAATTGRRTWTGGDWNGRTWTGSTWVGGTWTARTWSGRTWSGSTWSGQTWTSRTWSGSTWSGSTWSGRTWSGRTWSGQNWS